MDNISVEETPPDHRQYPRYDVHQRVWIKIGNEKQKKWMKFKTKNLSRYGTCVNLSGLPLMVGLKVKTKFDMVIFVDLAPNVIRVHHFQAYVMHIQRNGDVGFALMKRNRPL